ncbi:MAG: AAA family ATPase [Dehalococcoidales bacterium]|nr:AAA family ATPase [Dehalococcoidales bacterium]
MHLNRITISSQEFPTRDFYPFNLSILQNTDSISFTRPVTFFVGENGTGKSTLLKAICRRCHIHIWEDTEHNRYQYNSYEDELYKYIEIDWVNGSVPGTFFASQIFQDFARFLDEWACASPGILPYFGGNSLLAQSHGQSLLAFFKARYKIKGLYFLDEPETALSPKSQIKLLQILKNNSKAGQAQFIISTHSPILLAFPEATIYSFDKTSVETISYKDTEMYHLYKDFINNPEEYLEKL